MVSYLTPLTGLTEVLLRDRGLPLAKALVAVRSILPRNAVLIGQNIRQDVMWLDLKEGVDFEGMQDLQGLYRVWNSKVGIMFPTEFPTAFFAALSQVPPSHALFIGERCCLLIRSPVSPATKSVPTSPSQFGSFSVFSQTHLARVLLDWQDPEGPNEHDAAEVRSPPACSATPMPVRS